MSILNSAKSTVIAAFLASSATIAHATPVAQVTTNATVENNSDQIRIMGSFTIDADPSFDFSATSGLQVDVSTTLNSVTTFESFIIATGGETAALTTSLLGSPVFADPDLFDLIFFETFEDGDLDVEATDLGDAFYNFIFTSSNSVGNTTSAEFLATIAFGAQFDPNAQMPMPDALSTTVTLSPAAIVPLPATLPLLVLGTAGLVTVGRRRKGARS